MNSNIVSGYIDEKVREGLGWSIIQMLSVHQKDLIPLIIGEIDRKCLAKMVLKDKDGFTNFVLRYLNPVLFKVLYGHDVPNCSLDIFFGDNDTSKLINLLTAEPPLIYSFSGKERYKNFYGILSSKRVDLVLNEVMHMMYERDNLTTIDNDYFIDKSFYRELLSSNMRLFHLGGENNLYISFTIIYFEFFMEDDCSFDEYSLKDQKEQTIVTPILIEDYLKPYLKKIIIDGEEFSYCETKHGYLAIKDGTVAGMVKNNFIEPIIYSSYIRKEYTILSCFNYRFPFKVMDNMRIKYTPYYVVENEVHTDIDLNMVHHFKKEYQVNIDLISSEKRKKSPLVLERSKENPNTIYIKDDPGNGVSKNRYYYTQKKCKGICSDNPHDNDYGLCKKGYHRLTHRLN